MSIVYRYVCATENEYVEETRAIGAPVPTVCIHEGSAIVAGSLVIVKQPEEHGDISFVSGSEANFSGAAIVGLSHTDLDDIGTHSHADIDSHINDPTIHRSIDDNSTSATSLWSASKITSSLAGKSNTGHTHVAADILDFESKVDTRANDRADARIALQKAQNSGLASLDSNGKIPSSQIPALAFTTVTVVADIAARDAITSPNPGDIVKVIDSDGDNHPSTYIWGGESWIEIQETSDVISVAGKTGVVTLDTSDVSEGSNLYYTDARVEANSAVAAATAHIARTDNPNSVNKQQVGLGNLVNIKSEYAKTVDPTVDDDSTLGYSIGSRWIVLPTDHEFLCTDASEGAAIWKNTTSRVEQVALDYSTKSATYSVARTLLYRGVSLSGISGIKVIAAIDNADSAYTFDLRVVDYDNDGAVIAQVTGLSGAIKSVRSLGSLSNVPSSDNVLELQVRRSGTLTGNSRVSVYALVIEYN